MKLHPHFNVATYDTFVSGRNCNRKHFSIACLSITLDDFNLILTFFFSLEKQFCGCGCFFIFVGVFLGFF